MTPSLLLLLALWAPRAPACDGTPPALINQDTAPHAYTLTCGKKVKKREIAVGAQEELEGFSGCELAVGEQRESLHTEMVCTIQAGGKLVCDLL